MHLLRRTQEKALFANQRRPTRAAPGQLTPKEVLLYQWRLEELGSEHPKTAEARANIDYLDSAEIGFWPPWHSSAG